MGTPNLPGNDTQNDLTQAGVWVDVTTWFAASANTLGDPTYDGAKWRLGPTPGDTSHTAYDNYLSPIGIWAQRHSLLKFRITVSLDDRSTTAYELDYTFLTPDGALQVPNGGTDRYGNALYVGLMGASGGYFDSAPGDQVDGLGPDAFFEYAPSLGQFGMLEFNAYNANASSDIVRPYAPYSVTKIEAFFTAHQDAADPTSPLIAPPTGPFDAEAGGPPAPPPRFWTRRVGCTET